jgi:integrase
LKYDPKRDLPNFAREFKTLSPSKLAETILNRRNKRVTPESITMWFNRHSDIYDELAKEIIEDLPTAKEEVSQSIFQNGSFQELSTVKNWILEMNARELSEHTISSKVITLRQLCQGNFPLLHIDLVAEGKMCLKHPDRLVLKDALEIITMLKEKKVDATYFKHVLKDFLLSKGIVIGKKIVVGRSKSFGKYAKLYVPIEKLRQMLQWIRSQNYEAYVCDLFMLKTATRITATLNALIEKIFGNNITVYDKGRRSKYPEGHPWDKHLDAELMTELEKIIGERKAGNIFSVKADVLADLTRQAIQMFAPEVLEQYPDLMPNHFWRHMFAQLMLRLWDWNYGKVASVGGWTPQALEESYGKPPQEKVKEWAETQTITIQVRT